MTAKKIAACVTVATALCTVVWVAMPTTASARSSCSLVKTRFMFADHIHANVQCHKAHRVARKVFHQWKRGNFRDHGSFRAGGRKWACRGTDPRQHVGIAHPHCKSGNGRVRFRAGSLLE